MPLHVDLLFILPQLGFGELSAIIVLVLILFGPGKLPGVMKALGDGARQFKDAMSGQPQEAAKNIESSEKNTP